MTNHEDFGFTRAYKGGRLLDTYCGSTAYAAPEILSKEKYSGPAADIWSLGVIFYTLICGFLPFDDENESEIHKKIFAVEYEVPEFLSELAIDLLSRIFKSNQPDRITIHQLQNHSFLGSEMDDLLPIPVSECIPSDDLSRDAEKTILESMNALGFDTRHVIDSVKNHACNQSSALFHFLLIKRVIGNDTVAFTPTTSGRRSIMMDMMKSTPQSRRGSNKPNSVSVPVAQNILEEEEDGGWDYED